MKLADVMNIGSSPWSKVFLEEVKWAALLVPVKKLSAPGELIPLWTNMLYVPSEIYALTDTKYHELAV